MEIYVKYTSVTQLCIRMILLPKIQGSVAYIKQWTVLTPFIALVLSWICTIIYRSQTETCIFHTDVYA
jgi:hypothetical protein